MIPLQDENPSSKLPFVNWALIAANVIVFLYTLVNGSLADPSCTMPSNTICKYALVPNHIIRGADYTTFLTSMFLHGGFLHIGGNMLYLYIFGDNVEDLAGRLGYLAFYLVVGFAGSLTHIASDPTSLVPTIGASGAISGVLGAYFRKFPRARVRALILYGFWARIILVPAYLLIGFWFVYQLIFAFLAVEGGVAYFAHVGGFVAGLLIGGFLKPRTTEYQF